MEAKRIVEEAVSEVINENVETQEQLGRKLLSIIRQKLTIEDYPDDVVVETMYVTGTLHYPPRVKRKRKYRNDATDCWGFVLRDKDEHEEYDITKTMLKELGVEKISADDPRVKEWVEIAKKRKWKWLDIPEEVQETVIKELEKYLNLDVDDAYGYPRLLAFYVLSVRDDSPDEKWNGLTKRLPGEWG